MSARLDDDRPMGREYEALALAIEAGGLMADSAAPTGIEP